MEQQRGCEEDDEENNEITLNWSLKDDLERKGGGMKKAKRRKLSSTTHQ